MSASKSKLGFVGLALVGSLTLSGCSIPLPDIGLADIQSGVEDLQNLAQGATEFSADDLMYAQMMIPHHEQAVEMAELAATRTSNTEVLAIAKKIKSAQAPEIAVMAAWLGGKAAELHTGHDMQMNGMLTGAEFEKLQNAVDAEFDSLFVKYMIAHHEGAIEMTQGILQSENIIVKKFGEKVVKDQTAEIKQLKAILG
ncbi:MAG: hypothetical protein RL570_428 [Actinomycetota bacterium]|jgi:uncharacterized protein (DUF305 family)